MSYPSKTVIFHSFLTFVVGSEGFFRSIIAWSKWTWWSEASISQLRGLFGKSWGHGGSLASAGNLPLEPYGVSIGGSPIAGWFLVGEHPIYRNGWWFGGIRYPYFRTPPYEEALSRDSANVAGLEGLRVCSNGMFKSMKIYEGFPLIPQLYLEWPLPFEEIHTCCHRCATHTCQIMLGVGSKPVILF